LEKERAELREALARAADVIGCLTQKADSLQGTRCNTERQQAEEPKSTATNGDIHEEIPPVREASTKRVLRSRVRKSS
jgi:hypothetical protein